MTQHDDLLYLRHMLDSAQKAHQYAAGKTRTQYNDDEVLRLALTHLLQIIGEAARSVSPEKRAELPQIPWAGVMGMRHRIVHNYAQLDDDLVWHTLQHDLLPLIEALEPLFADRNPPSSP